MMTFTEDPDFDKEQLIRYQNLCAALEKDGIALGRKHTCSSFETLPASGSISGHGAPGMALYRLFRARIRGMGILDLRPAMALKARVAYVKQLREGERANNRAYMARGHLGGDHSRGPYRRLAAGKRRSIQSSASTARCIRWWRRSRPAIRSSRSARTES
jgi:hypothetical protein